MKRLCAVLIALASVTSISSAQTQRLIVQDKLGLKALNKNCLVLGCSVVRNLGDPLGQEFLVTTTSTALNRVLSLLPLQLGVLRVETDQLLALTSPLLGPIPQELDDSIPVKYYGGIVWQGYVSQTANRIIRTSTTQGAFRLSGAGVVAVIDTGIDPSHPAFLGVLEPGYDFTRNTSGGSEMGDLDHSTAAVLDGGPETPMYINPSVAAVLNKSAVAALSNSKYSAFGHGTMTAGLVHLVAPTAKILPLKSFSANGTGYVSDVVRAVYYAAANHANIISMSFSFSSSSPALTTAIAYANTSGLICVAAAGNSGKEISVYPASLAHVMGVASTSDTDVQSSFTNYGPQVVWVAAPGEGVMSTYPGSTYATSSGTSFSTPLVAGTAALLINAAAGLNESKAASAIGHAIWLSPNLNNGRLDTYDAVSAWLLSLNTSAGSN